MNDADDILLIDSFPITTTKDKSCVYVRVYFIGFSYIVSSSEVEVLRKKIMKLMWYILTTIMIYMGFWKI